MAANSSPPDIIAALDLGTNSFHLVITGIRNGQLEILDTAKEEVRLGDGLDISGYLTPESQDRAIRHLIEIRRIIDSRGCQVRAVATHAIRSAKNHEELLARIETETGIHVELIDGYEEARLSWLGMRSAIDLNNSITLGVDIGGGSTELIIARNNDFHFISSLKTGTVTLRNRFFAMEDPLPDEIDRARGHILMTLSPLTREATRHTFRRAVACSGTAKALARIIHRQRKHGDLDDPNGFRFTREELAALEQRLIEVASPARIRRLFKVDKRRSEIILTGCMILRAIGDLLNVDEWTVSGSGLREGIAIDTFIRRGQLTSGNFVNIRGRSIRAVGDRHGLDRSFAENLQQAALLIYDALEPYFPMPDQAANRELLSHAAWLMECGMSVAYKGYHKHTSYMILNGVIPGFSEEEKALIAYICRHSRKKPASQKGKNKSALRKVAPHLRRINFLASCLRIARALNRSRAARVVSAEFDEENHVLFLQAKYDSPRGPEADQQSLLKERKHLAKALGIPLEPRLQMV